MIFISLIVVSYLSLVITDQRQTLDADLSASALAAARSGVEDGKRILVYCASNATDPNCIAVLNSTDNCSMFKAGNPGATLASTLSIPIDGSGQGSTGGATQYQQYFTCLTIQTKTPNATTPLSADNDYIQPLRTVSPFSQLRVSWSGTGSYVQNTGTLSNWPTLANWKAQPVIRLQIIPYTNLSNLDTVEAATKTVYIVPCQSGSIACTSSLKDINVLDVRSPAGSLRGGSAPVTYASCTITSGIGYQCAATLTGFSGGSAGTTQYYARTTLLYASSTTLQLAALDGSGNSVNFDNVQPIIDVTGRANDVFKRIQTQVSYAQNPALPQNALESAAPVCKDMTVTADPTSSTYNCN